MTEQRTEQGKGDVTIMTDDEDATADAGVPELVRSIHGDLDLPDGYRAEIIGGALAVVPPPFGRHSSIIELIRDGVRPVLPAGFRLHENTTLEEPETDRYVPDLAAWPFSLIHNAEKEWVFPAAECIFAVEVTSPGQEARDYTKANGYSRGGVPVFLLVDRKIRKCFVYTDPTPEGYAASHWFPFGDPVTLTFENADGEPRTAKIDTSDF